MEVPGWQLALPGAGASHQPQPGRELQAMQLFSISPRSAQYFSSLGSSAGGCFTPP